MEGLLFITFALFGVSSASKYSREALQEKYPGFGTKWIPMENDDEGGFTVGYFENPLGESRLSLSPDPSEAVTFTLYTRQHPGGEEVNSTSSWASIFNKSNPSKFVTHGWMSSGSKATCISIKDGFLEKYDSNVFIMDWSPIAGNVIYPIPMMATTGVADYYSKFLNELVDMGADPSDFHLVGHSLGAHVSGFAARKLKKGKIGRISGLDPALPGFDVGLINGGHLNKTDADFVDVIHTCAGFLGMMTPLGHADFYPNGGSPPQPGCGSIIEMIEACSHGRSWRYFAESLTSEKPFLAYHCDSFQNFIQKTKCKEQGIPMGETTPDTARGTYYLRTDAEAPFVKLDNII